MQGVGGRVQCQGAGCRVQGVPEAIGSERVVREAALERQVVEEARRLRVLPPRALLLVQEIDFRVEVLISGLRCSRIVEGFRPRTSPGDLPS